MLGFELFDYTFTFRHLLYQPKKQFFRLPVDIRKITVQLAAYEQVGVKYFAVFPDIPQVPLSLPADRSVFFFGGQERFGK